MLICVGPVDGNVTGQSECLTKIGSSYLGAVLISNGGEGLSFIQKVIFALLAALKLIFFIFTNSNSKVLLSVSRSPRGFVKDLPIFIICYILRIDFYLHVHGNDAANLFESRCLVISKLANFFYSNACIIIVPNSFVLTQFSRFPNVCKKILHNFHDIEEIDFINKKSGVLGVRKILYLSSVMADKGIFEVLSCYEKLVELTDKIELHIAGPMMLNREEKVLFFRKLKQLNGFYYGTVKGEDKSKLLVESDILLFPSKYQTEASPLVVLEAMSTDTAILVYSHNNIESVLPVDTYQYQVIQSYDFGELLSRIQLLLKNKDILDICKEKNKIEARKYTLTRYISELRKIVEGINK